jgi:hypothetical protein
VNLTDYKTVSVFAISNRQERVILFFFHQTKKAQQSIRDLSQLLDDNNKILQSSKQHDKDLRSKIDELNEKLTSNENKFKLVEDTNSLEILTLKQNVNNCC